MKTRGFLIAGCWLVASGAGALRADSPKPVLSLTEKDGRPAVVWRGKTVVASETRDAALVSDAPAAGLTSVRLGGVDLGVKAWGPYEWEIPAAMLGRKTTLEVSLWTSANPMFGAADAPGAAWDTRFWFKVSAPDYACGLLSAEFVR